MLGYNHVSIIISLSDSFCPQLLKNINILIWEFETQLGNLLASGSSTIAGVVLSRL